MANFKEQPAPIEILKKHSRSILFVWLVSVAVFFAREEIVKPQWRAKATILMAFDDQVATLGVGLLASKADPIKMLGAVLASDNLNKAVGVSIANGPKKVPFDTRLDTPSGQIYITYNDDSKTRAKYCVESVISSLRDIESSVGFTTASQEAKNLKRNVEARAKEVADAEDDLRTFQDNLKTVIAANVPYYGGSYRALMEPIKLQLKKINKELEVRKQQAVTQGLLSAELPTSLPPSIRWRDNLIKLEEDLRLAQISSGPEAPNVVRTKKSIETTKALINNEVSKYLSSVANNMDAVISTLYTQKIIAEDQLAVLKKQDEVASAEAIEFQRKVQTVTGLRRILQDATERYTAANLKAEAQKVRWSVLDKPEVESKPVNKSLVMVVVLGSLIGLIVAALYAYLVELVICPMIEGS